jgi:hypothetical protein
MSDAPTTASPADPFQQLPKAVYRTIIADLYTDIPPPHLTDPELIAERVHAAIAETANRTPGPHTPPRASCSPPTATPPSHRPSPNRPRRRPPPAMTTNSPAATRPSSTP